MDHNKVLPQWAPRVPQALIRRFSASDARGFYDDVLIDEVGYALLSRCQSVESWYLVSVVLFQSLVKLYRFGRLIQADDQR